MASPVSERAPVAITVKAANYIRIYSIKKITAGSQREHGPLGAAMESEIKGREEGWSTASSQCRARSDS